MKERNGSPKVIAEDMLYIIKLTFLLVVDEKKFPIFGNIIESA